jgi:hypothetical protein
MGVSEKQLNSGHAAAPVESVRRVPVSRTHRLFFIWNLAVGVSPPKDDAARLNPGSRRDDAVPPASRERTQEPRAGVAAQLG